jgi:ketosteroid isomerase-like protein
MTLGVPGLAMSALVCCAACQQRTSGLAYAHDIVSFDVDPPLRYAGADNKRRAWQEFFARYTGPLTMKCTT